jgi:glycosyltransferase involved in cell wall biosynthesis
VTGTGASPARVSVVVPVLDPGPDLRTALASLVAQTVTDWEAIVVDDGSTEDLGWVDHVDPRIRRVRQQRAGVSRARNAGVATARAVWVAFLDHDDAWAPEKLGRQLAELERTGADVCHSAFTWVHRDCDGESARDRRYPHPLGYQDMLVGDHVCTSSVLLRRATFLESGGFDDGLRKAEDLELWLRLLRAGARFAVVDEPLVTYVSHAAGASSDYEGTYRARRSVLRDHLRSARADRDAELVRAARAGLRRGRELAGAQALDQARASSGSARLRHVARAVAHDPRFATRSLRRALHDRVAGTRVRRPAPS